MALPALPITWTLDGFSFNAGVDAYGHSAVVTVPEWESPPGPKPKVLERTEGHGAYQGPNYRAGKAMTIKGTAQADSPASRETLRDRLAALCLDPDTFYPMTVHNPYRSVTDLTRWVKLNDDLSLTRLPDGISIDIDIPVFAADGWLYSADNPSKSTPLASQGTDGILWNGSPSASGGIEWNGSPTVTGGLVYESGQGSSGVIRLTNSGTVAAPILLTITALAVTPTIVAIQTQQTIKWVGTVASPNTLTIDTKTGRATLNSGSSSIDVGAALSNNDQILVPANGFIDLAYSASLGSSGTQLIGVNKNVYA